MLLCGNCRRISPADSVFCGYCAHALGGRRCRNGHLSPLGVRCCTTCGLSEEDLSAGAACVALGWLPRLLAAATAVAGLGLLWRAGGALAPKALTAAPPGISSTRVFDLVLGRLFVWLVLSAVLLGLLPRPARTRAVRAAVNVLCALVGGALRGALLLGALLGRAVFGGGGRASGGRSRRGTHD